MTAKAELTIPLSISAGIHIGVIAILALGIDFSTEPKPMAQPQASAPAVQAVVVDQKLVDKHVEKLKAQKREAERKEKARQDDADKRVREARKEREREQAKIKKLEQQRKQKELETQKANAAATAAKLKQQQEKKKAEQAELARKQKEKERKASEVAAKKAADKLKAEQAAAKKAEEERKRKAEEERKRKAEAERKRRAEEKARLEQEQMMQDALASEQAALSQTRNKQVMSEVQRYTSMIIATIARNVRKEESMRNKSCKVSVRLAKDGFVTSNRIVEGDPALCSATQAAIQRLQKLPMSSEPAVYDKLKELNIIYRPEFN
ncbi:cell envelope integrity protein TolA [Shewanella youngdeokensis]|uniref:Cell envelope integrity protein TolA n=1 Tax=Shewanella youngdeokensis TaxID=2999068 RepID=A0ABZ0K1T7_9GAMM|nr:cell envelope integrity protein TolA [Shewanella sp. DAU334]